MCAGNGECVGVESIMSSSKNLSTLQQSRETLTGDITQVQLVLTAIVNVALPTLRSVPQSDIHSTAAAAAAVEVEVAEVPLSGELTLLPKGYPRHQHRVLCLLAQ